MMENLRHPLKLDSFTSPSTVGRSSSVEALFLWRPISLRYEGLLPGTPCQRNLIRSSIRVGTGRRLVNF